MLVSQNNTISLEQFNQELFSVVRRSINNLRQKQIVARKQGLRQLMKIAKQHNLPASIFQEITYMGLKEIIKCYYDFSEANRENSILLTIQLLSRCKNINALLPYILEALKDRTNCIDLDGIDKLPQKLRPHPGQKPKVMLKIIQNCEQIRVLYCQLIKRIILLIDKDQHEMVKYLDDMVNIQRALVMDPASDIQKTACETLEIFCKDYKDILLHFTQNMGRAILLSLVSKKSKIRISGLNTLTAIFWCGLWKYNAFVFENLIGFRDPNSVPIKDFYEPNHNVNYLATFIIDPNVKVRREFMKHIKIWVCQLNDRYDHHGKIVPYLLSGLSDEDDEVSKIAKQTIEEIGRQIEEEKQKQFRESKQFAIDSKWTWSGKLINLPIQPPLQNRPSLGSRYFIRGHVRRFWSALYKQIRDIKQQNRLRSAKLALYGAIFTENYLTQFLDNMIPQLLPSIISHQKEDQKVAQLIAKIFYYIGRYCQQSAYIHLMQAALDGKLIQNEEFVKCAMKGLSMLIKGNLQAIPKNQSLCHKKQNIIELLRVIEECQIAGDVYNFNCIEAKQIGICILEGIQKTASQQQRLEILGQHFLNLLKLLSVSQYESLYSVGFSLQKSDLVELDTSKQFGVFVVMLDRLMSLYDSSFDQLQEYLENIFCDPPSLMDSQWKVIIILYRYLCWKGQQKEQVTNDLFFLTQDAICSCINKNKSVQTLIFTSKLMHNLILNNENPELNCLNLSTKLLNECMMNLNVFKPIKKVPIYDQHLNKQETDPSIVKTADNNFILIFSHCSSALVYYYINKLQVRVGDLAELINSYIACVNKLRKYPESVVESVRTLWGIFSKIPDLNEEFPNQLVLVQKQGENKPIFPIIIQFCVERLEEYLQSHLNAMIFNILEKIVHCWPKVKTITEKLPNVYPNFPDLLDKLFKYCLNEKDRENKQLYMMILSKLAKKMPQWFKYESNLAKNQKRYEKSRMLQEIVKDANI